MPKKTAKGRPKFNVKPGQRVTVELLVAVGETHDFIARAIGCCPLTLRTHFRSELDYGAARMRAAAILMLYRSARAGNVSAMRKFEELTRAAAAADRLPKPKPLGKKAQAQLDADNVANGGSSWGNLLKPPDPPKRIN